MNPKDGLRPYLQRDIDDILEALVDDRGNVNAQIMLDLNGKRRLVNVGLIKHVAEWLYNRPETRVIDDVIADVCQCAFVDYQPQVDTIDGQPLPRRLMGMGMTKRGDKMTASMSYRRCINGRVFGPPIDVHYYTEKLTKFQQTYIMHLLLSLGSGGHAGQGMAGWDFYYDAVEQKTEFKQDL